MPAFRRMEVVVVRPETLAICTYPDPSVVDRKMTYPSANVDDVAVHDRFTAFDERIVHVPRTAWLASSAWSTTRTRHRPSLPPCRPGRLPHRRDYPPWRDGT